MAKLITIFVFLSVLSMVNSQAEYIYGETVNSSPKIRKKLNRIRPNSAAANSKANDTPPAFKQTCLEKLYHNASFNKTQFNLTLIYDTDTKKSFLKLTRLGPTQPFQNWANIIFDVDKIRSFQVKNLGPKNLYHDFMIVGWTEWRDFRNVSGSIGSYGFRKSLGKRSLKGLIYRYDRKAKSPFYVTHVKWQVFLKWTGNSSEMDRK